MTRSTTRLLEAAVGLFLIVAVFTIGCGGGSGGGVLLRGSFLMDGNDVVEVQVTQATTQEEAAGKLVERLGRAEFPVDWFERDAGYLQTNEIVMGDSLALRLNVALVESTMVEVTGQYRFTDEGADGEWRQIAYDHDGPDSSLRYASTAQQVGWVVLFQASASLGQVTGYGSLPSLGDSCQGRPCGHDAECRDRVCRCPDGYEGYPYDSCSPSGDS